MALQTDIDLEIPEDQLARVFELDVLFDGLTSGRLCGQPMEAETAQLLIALLERLEWKPDIHALSFALPHYPKQFGLAEIRDMLTNLGFVSDVIPIFGRRLKFCLPGTLVCDAKGELWLIRRDKTGALLCQPGETERTQRIDPVRTYRTIRFERQSENARRRQLAEHGSWSSNLVFRFLPEIRMMFLLTMFSGLAAILVAFGITKIFDTIIPTRNQATLMGLLVGLAMVAGAELFLRRLRAGVIARVSGRVEYLLGTSLFSKLLKLPANMLANASESDQFARLKQFETIREIVGGPILVLALELSLAMMLLIAVAVVAWQLAFVLSVLAGIFILAAIVMAPAVRRATKLLGTVTSEFNEATFALLANRRQIRRDGLFETVVEDARGQLRDLVRARRKLSRIVRILDGLAFASLPLAAALVIGMGAILVMNATLSAGQLIAATILTWRLFSPIQQVLQILPKLPEMKRLLAQVDALFRLPEQEAVQRGLSNRPCYGDVVVKNLVVRFPNAHAPSLMCSELEIPRGQLVAVTGRSGSGKSTLLRVLAGNIRPQAGLVLVDDINHSQLSQAFRNRHIVYVSQEPLYFFGTVAQNLRLCAPDADDGRLMAVLDELGLSDWVASLPDGLATRIDPATMTDILSPGHRTLIAVAQALLVEPTILLLDEPTGGLDAMFEEKLLGALEARKGAVTTLMVTHRPSLLRRSDAVIVVDGGAAVLRAPGKVQRVAS